jgi:hypothetical protein
MVSRIYVSWDDAELWRHLGGLGLVGPSPDRGPPRRPEWLRAMPGGRGRAAWRFSRHLTLSRRSGCGVQASAVEFIRGILRRLLRLDGSPIRSFVILNTGSRLGSSGTS